jgi:hypothetical protein
MALNKLSGTVPDNIFELTELSEFDLFDNQLSGTIPTLVDRMISNFNGAIPEELYQCKKLNALLFPDNKIISFDSFWRVVCPRTW